MKTSYEIMKSAIDKKYSPTKKEIKKINPFFMLKFISNDPNSIYIANALNSLNNVPIEAQYNFVRNSTLDKVSFISSTKKEEPNNDVLIIMKHFNVSAHVAKDYLKILGKDKIEAIHEMYSFGKSN